MDSWFIFNVVLTHTYRSFSAELLFSQLVLSLYWTIGLFFPMDRTGHFPLLKFMR